MLTSDLCRFSFYLTIYTSFCLSVCMPVCMSVCQFVYLSRSICLSTCLFVHLSRSIYLYTYHSNLSIYISIYPAAPSSQSTMVQLYLCIVIKRKTESKYVTEKLEYRVMKNMLLFLNKGNISLQYYHE